MKKKYLFLILSMLIGIMLVCGCNGEDTDTRTESDLNTETETADTSLNTQTENDEENVEPSTNTENESETETETEFESETETETETELETETETDTTSNKEEHVHTIGFIIAKAPTCTEDGYTESKMCSVCKEVILAPVKLEATGHSWVYTKRKEPLCESKGSTEGVKCETCGEVALKQETIPALGHSWVDVPVKPSTCKDKGYSAGKKCENCGVIYNGCSPLPLSDHKYVIHAAKEPTCQEGGYEMYKSCATCEYESAHEVYARLSHNYDENYVCTLCQKSAAEIQGLHFSLNRETNEYRLTGVSTPELVSTFYQGVELKTPRIVIPSTHNDLPVTEIDEYSISLSFPWDGTVLELVIPSTVTYIHKNAIRNQSYLEINYLGGLNDWCNINFDAAAFRYIESVSLKLNGELVTDLLIPKEIGKINPYQFANITSLKKVTIEEGITLIDKYAFAGSGITEVTIPKSVKEIKTYAFDSGKLEKINYLGEISDFCAIEMSGGGLVFYSYTEKSLYINGEVVKNLVIPSSVSEIKPYAFYAITSIESVTFSEGVTKIGEYAFESTNVKIISLPKSIAEIGTKAFTTGKKQITYQGTLEGWCNISFAPYLQILKNAELYIEGELIKELVIPSSVTEISSYAFSNYTRLTSVVFENGVKKIGTGAFFECTNLESIELPESLTEIGSQAFESCKKLTSVEFPPSLTTLGSFAFAFSGIKIAILPDSLTELGGYVFFECKSLEAVVIPELVTTISGNTNFYNCPNLLIFCKATQKPSGWIENWYGNSAKYYWYSESVPTTIGNYWRYVDGNICVW